MGVSLAFEGNVPVGILSVAELYQPDDKFCEIPAVKGQQQHFQLLAKMDLLMPQHLLRQLSARQFADDKRPESKEAHFRISEGENRKKYPAVNVDHGANIAIIVLRSYFRRPFMRWTVTSSSLKKALRLAVPIIAGQLGIIIMNMLDLLMVGDLGKTAVAAVTHANNLFFLVYFLGMGLLFAISAKVAIHVGEGNSAKGYLTLRAGMIISLITFAVLSVATELLVQNIGITNPDHPNVTSLAAPFLRVLNYSALPMLIFLSYKQFTDGLGKTVPGMVITLCAVVLNAFLNWVFIYGNLGSPAMGVTGAGYATLFSRIAMCIAMIAYVHYSSFTRSHRPQVPFGANEKKAEMKETFQMALPIGLQFFAEVACFALAGIFAGWLGEGPQAAHGVALQLAAFTYMFCNGLAAAGTIMSGNAFGEHNRRGVYEAAYSVLTLVLVCEVIFSLLFVFFGEFLGSFFSSDPAFISLVTGLLVMAAFFQIADGVQVAAIGLLRGVEDVKFPSTMAIVGYWVIALPVGLWLAFKTSLGVYGIWIGFNAGLWTVAIAMYFRFFKIVKNVPDKINYIDHMPE